MTDTDPTTPAGLSFVFASEAEPAGDDPEPCVWCNHPAAVESRKQHMGSHTRPAAGIPDAEATRYADYVFTVGDPEAGVEIPACEGCLHDLPVQYGDTTIHDLPFAWKGEVAFRVEVPAGTLADERIVSDAPVTALMDLLPSAPDDD
jgi:hypothetical protein